MSDSVYDILVGLGGTGNEVANSLKLKGIKGKQGYPQECPIAAYLKMQTVQSPQVNAYIVVYGPLQSKINVPSAVRNFIREFDAGHYPDLMLDDEL